MKKRLISGTVYVCLLLGFYFLKVFIPGILGEVIFDVFTLFCTVVGAFEMTRALHGKITPLQRLVVMVVAATLIPAADIFYYCLGVNFLFVAAVYLFAAAVILVTLLVFQYQTTSVESVACSLLSVFYPVVLLFLVFLANHLPQFSREALLLTFVISPCADSFAFLFGVLFGKKLPKKMSPEISPKKTVIGGFGGVFGGVVGAVVLFFIYYACCAEQMPWNLLPLYIVIGAVASLATELGDLVESAVKRKVGIKDMGKIMPGHGGALDRLDGSMYAAIVVYFCLRIYLAVV